MSLKKRVIEIEIDKKAYEMALDFESAIEFQDIYGKPIFDGIQDITNKQDVKAMAVLIASCLKENGKCVGMEFVKGLDLMQYLPMFMEKLGELMNNSLPTEDKETKSKTKK